MAEFAGGGASRSPRQSGQVLCWLPLWSVALTLDLHSAHVEQRKTSEDAAVFDHLGQIGALLKAASASEANADTPRILRRVRLDKHAQDDQRDRHDGQSHRLHPLRPTHYRSNTGARDLD